MSMLARFKTQLVSDEGWKNKPYKDHLGILTIGPGFNLEEGFTDEELELVFEHRVIRRYSALLTAFPIVKDLSDPRQAALLNMAWQMGIPRLRGFKKMWKAIDGSLWDQASLHGLDSKWAKQTPARAKRVMEQLSSGEWV